MKSQIGNFSNCLALRRCVLFLVAAVFSAVTAGTSTFLSLPLALAEESSSSYFGSAGDDEAPLDAPAGEDKPKKLKSAHKKGTTKPGKKVRLSKKPVRISTTPDLSFDRKRINKDPSLELDFDTPAEGADPEVAVSPDVERRINEAEKLEAQKKWQDAIHLLKPVTASLPRQGLLALARSFAAVKDFNEEVRILDLSKNKYPKDYVSITKLGIAYSKTKKSAEAIQNFYDAKELNPRYKPAYEGLLAELQIQGDSYEARTLAQDMIVKFGAEPKYFTALCRLYTKDAFLDKAVETCETASQKDSNVPENYVNLAIALRDKLEPERALATMNDAASKFPNAESVLSMQGLVYADKKDHLNAYNSYKRAATFAPKSVGAWVGYGKAAYDLHKYQESLDAFKKACKIDSHAVKDFREWQYKFTDALSSCN